MHLSVNSDAASIPIQAMLYAASVAAAHVSAVYPPVGPSVSPLRLRSEESHGGGCHPLASLDDKGQCVAAAASPMGMGSRPAMEPVESPLISSDHQLQALGRLSYGYVGFENAGLLRTLPLAHPGFGPTLEFHLNDGQMQVGRQCGVWKGYGTGP